MHFSQKMAGVKTFKIAFPIGIGWKKYHKREKKLVKNLAHF